MKKLVLLLGCFAVLPAGLAYFGDRPQAAFGILPLACTTDAINYTCAGAQTCPVPDGGVASEGGALDAGGGGGDATSTSEGGACDPTQTPLSSACLSDGVAIFVSPAGSDTNAGTMESPVGTLAHALVLARATSSHLVVACAGAYAEALTLSASAGDDVGLSLFGGAACAETPWTYPGTPVAVVTSPGPGPALQASGLAKTLSLADLELDGPTATGTGASSIGAFLSSVTTGNFTNVKLVAKDGTGGASGTTGDNYADAGVANGKSASDDGGVPAPGAAVTCSCANGSQTTGGSGGVQDAGAGAGLPAWGGGTPGTNDKTCQLGGSGFNGQDAPISPSDAGLPSLGILTGSGWTPGGGATGASGSPGQGGGGGGDGPDDTGAGGGGACGGCGGAGGSGGQAGGSSIALLTYQSKVSLSMCVLSAGNAGAGGAGGSGQAGQSGQAGGTGVPQAGNGAACSAGAGGDGAGGNGGGGGAGGTSVGIAYVGTAPSIDGQSITNATSLANVTVGSAGDAGTGGAGGSAASGSTNVGGAGQAGVVGSSQAVLQVP